MRILYNIHTNEVLQASADPNTIRVPTDDEDVATVTVSDPNIFCGPTQYIGGVVKVTLNRAKESKEQEILNRREEEMLVVGTPSGNFYADDRSKILMLGKLLSIFIIERVGGTIPTEVTWKLTTGWTVIPIEDFMTACLYVLAGIEDVYATQATLEGELSSATTVEDVESVEWPE